jgi:hypothetical protein
MEYKINTLIKSLSNSPTIKSDILKSLSNSVNVYIHNRQIEVSIQEYESDTDYIQLNRAITFEDYSNLKELYSFPVYTKFLEDFNLFCGENTEQKELVIIPLGITFFDKYKSKIKYNGKHSAVTIINLKTKTIFIVDSDNEETVETDNVIYNESNYDYYLKRKVKACIECIYNDKFKIKIVDIKAPQFLTKDNYCIFWTFLITEMIIKKYDETKKIAPSSILKQIMTECDTKKKCDLLIHNYIKKFI